MATYTPSKILFPNGLDEAGTRLGMQRMFSESLADYRDRLLFEIFLPTNPSQVSYHRAANLHAGEQDIAVFEIDLIRNASGIPLAADPKIEITSGYFRAYDDYDAGSLDVEVNIIERTGAYFLRDIVTALTGSAYFTTTILDADHTYKKSRNLRIENSERYVFSDIPKESRMHETREKLIKELNVGATDLFITDKSTPDLIVDDGDFAIDYTNGIIWTKDPLRGAISYTYRKFPYTVYWQKARTVPLNDVDRKYIFRDQVISDTTGALSYDRINSYGAMVLNQIIMNAPDSWGE